MVFKPVNYVHPDSRLLFIEQTSKQSGKWEKGEKQTQAKARYKCVCGKEIETDISKVKNGHTISCGCIRKERQFKKHGFYSHPLYKTFYNIWKRCYVTTNQAYCNYGGRGVVICDEWLKDPISFVKWGIENGWEKGLEVDKDIIPLKLDIPAVIYSPEMCSIATRKEQMNAIRNNHKITLNGVTKNLCQWSEETGIARLTIYARLKKGWTVFEALTTPVDKKYQNGRTKK